MEPTKQPDSYEKLFEVAKRSLPVFALIFGIIVLLGLVLYLFAIPFDVYLIWKIYDYVVFKIVDISGFNKWLVKGIVIIALIPLLWVLPRVYRGKYKKAARAAGLFYVGLFFLTLFFLSKDAYFTREGRPAKFYIVTSSGVKYVDSEDIDRATGRKPQPVTPEILEKLKRWEKGIIDFRRVDPTSTPWFNPLTGKPEIWYYQNPGGTFEFYNKDGFHPNTSEPLKAVTNEVYQTWREKAQKEAESVAKQAEKEKRKESVQVDRLSEVDEKEKRLNELKLLINEGINIIPGMKNVALMIESNKTESGVSPENTLYSHLKKEKINIVNNLFKEDLFKRRGYFKEIYDGNTDLLRQSGALSKVDGLILGRLTHSVERKGEVDRELLSCRINFSYKLIGKNGDLVRTDSINVVGPGFSEETAIERGLEILSEKYADRIFESIL